ncbi:MAG: hypothetical protein K0R15_1174 [Clostridiales bacterium]|jgi:flagellar basal-body rod protein FlgB|nr:hypothetical protein [Clostridiales bacterium]
MITDAFKNIDVYSKAINATSLRQQAISSNIANVDTPGYKRQDVIFESMLQDALKMNGNNVKKINLDSISPKLVTDRSNMSYRMDKNNVDIDTETAAAAKNQLRYNALIDRVISGFDRITSSMKNR